jgi:hypothetical protein
MQLDTDASIGRHRGLVWRKEMRERAGGEVRSRVPAAISFDLGTCKLPRWAAATCKRESPHR